MPLIKLGYLLIRTISKPVSSIIKRQARTNSKFREGCQKIAQSYHRIEIKMARKLANDKGGEREIKKLNQEKAVEVGSEFIGEALVFGVAGILLVLDQSRTYKRDKRRKLQLEERLKKIEEALHL